MPGFIQNGATNVIASGINSPTITGVAQGDTLYSFYWVDAINATIAAPTDSAGQTWSAISGATFSNAGGSGGLFGLLNANAGTHTLSYATRANVNGAGIMEANGYGLTGGTPVTSTATAAVLTSGSYTPSVSNELVLAALFEAGFQTNDAVHCTTAAFQSLGSLADSTPHSCWMINQNGNTQCGCESNAQVIASGTALTCAWAWVSATFSFSIVAGFAPLPVVPATPKDTSAQPSALRKIWQAVVDYIPNLLATTLAIAAPAPPPGVQLSVSAPPMARTVSAIQPHNRLTLGIPAPPAGPPLPLSSATQDDSAPAVKYQPQLDVYQRPLTLGIPSGIVGPPLPLSSATQDDSAPSIKYRPQVDVYAYPLTLVPVQTFLPLFAQSTDASSPAAKSNVQVDLYQNNLLLGIPVLMPAWNEFDDTPTMARTVSAPQAVNLLPLQTPALSLLPQQAQTVDASAPAIRSQTQLDVYPYPLTLIPAQAVFLPLFAQNVDASAPAIKYQPQQADVYPYPITLGIPNLLLPQQAQTVDASAPAIKYQPQADVYPYPITLGIPTAGAGPPLPLSSITLDQSAPTIWYRPQVDVYPYPITLGIPAPPSLLPQQAQTVDASAPAVRYGLLVDVYPYPLTLVAPSFLPLGAQVVDVPAPIAKAAIPVDVFANRLPLVSSVVMPFLPVDASQPQAKFAVYAQQPTRPLTLGITAPPPGPRPLQLSASAPITKYHVFALMFPTTIYLPSSTELPALTFYDFEDPLAFMLDFNVTVRFGGIVAPAILSEPGQDVIGGRIESNQYEIEYVTSQLTLFYGAEVIIDGTTFDVLDVDLVDDGVFSKARLEGSPFINQSYSFEAPDAFLTDFATEATVVLTSQSAEVLLSQPGQSIMGGRISSNQYEIEYAKVELDLAYGVLLTIRGVTYKVIQVYSLDDGVFARAKLETT